MTQSHAPASASPALTRTIDEIANHCFGCGKDNSQSLKLEFMVSQEGAETVTAVAKVNLTRLHEGPPGHIHGGIIGVLFDEAMSKLNRPLNVLAMTRNLNIDYLRPAPLGVELTLRATHLRRDGRKLFHSAELTRPDGTLLARAQGLFIVIDPAQMAAAG